MCQLDLETLGGEALFVLPWLWLPMIILGVKALRGGDWRERLLACLAAPPIVVFALISAWSSQRVLYHWAAPGYLMLFPLLGCFVAEREKQSVAEREKQSLAEREQQSVAEREKQNLAGRETRLPALPWITVKRAILGTAALTLAAVAAVSLHIRTDALGWLMPAKDPTAEGLVWTSLRDDLIARGLLNPATVVGVPNWRDAGKIAHALGPDVPVLCINADCRQFGLIAPRVRWAGHDLLILIAGRPEQVLPILSRFFESLEALPDSQVMLRGRTVKTIGAAMGKHLKPTP